MTLHKTDDMFSIYNYYLHVRNINCEMHRMLLMH